MGSKRWKKPIPTALSSFRRPRGSARPGSSILIVTEGENTEPVYFDALKRKLSLQTVEIEIVPAGKGDPRRLAEAALEEQKKRRKDAKDGRLSFAKASNFDELWIVFDTDVPVEHRRFDDGVQFATAKGVKSAASSPCFEYWLLLHLVYTTAPMQKFSDVEPRLSKELGRPYAKNSKDSAGLIPPLLEHLDVAMTRARQARQHHATAATPSPANPSTEVDRLIESIRAAASPANLRRQ